MGWASGGDIFDAVAHAMANTEDLDIKRKVLRDLINELCANDWDTTDESLDEFRHDPVVVGVFYETGNGGVLEADNDRARAEGRIRPDWKHHRWTLECAGDSGHGPLSKSLHLTAAGHNRLVRTWLAHDRYHHDGDPDMTPEPQWLMTED